MGTIAISFSTPFAVHLPAAAIRLGSIYEGSYFEVVDLAIVARNVSADREASFRKAIQDTVYREKIYAETLPMRAALIATVTR